MPSFPINKTKNDKLYGMLNITVATPNIIIVNINRHKDETML